MNLLLDELREADKREWTVKQHLEDKASKNIVIIGIILPIFFGLFASPFFYSGDDFILNSYYEIIGIWFILGSGFSSMLCAILLLNPTTRYSKPINLDDYLDGKSYEVKNKVWLKYDTADEEKQEKVFKDMIEDYLHVITDNRKSNRKKAKFLISSIVFLMMLVFSIIAVMGIHFLL